MPVQVIKYRCRFKCGKQAVSQARHMETHEASCWNNPANKTCKTCENEVYETAYGEENTIHLVRSCVINALAEAIEKLEPILRFQNSAHVRPIYNCPYHNKKDDGQAGVFAKDLVEEIKGEKEGTAHYPFYNKPKQNV